MTLLHDDQPEPEYDKSVHLDDTSHRILQKLAQRNFRSKRKQLQVILIEEAKRQGINWREVSAKQ